MTQRGSTPRAPRPHRNRRVLRGLPLGLRSVALLAVLGALAILAGGWFAWDAASRARDVRAEVYAARAELDRAKVTVQALAGLDAGHLPSNEEIEAALLQIRAAKTHLEIADARLGYLPRLFPLAELLPPADGATEVPALLDVGLTVTGSAEDLLAAILPLLQDAPDSPTGVTTAADPGSAAGADLSLAERVRAVFVEDGDDLDAALAQLEGTRPEVDRLRARSWGALLDAAPGALDLLHGSLEEVPRAREAFAAIRTGLDPLFGFDRPKTYLIAGLNESEIRPTGGFMGTIGVVTVDRGHLTTSEFERVYGFERILEEYTTPPEDLARYMGAGFLQLRDANWWPDFPTSAEVTLDLFEVNQGFRPDGVIAINTLLTARLVGVFEPLDLPEYSETLTAANWRGVMENTLLEGRNEFGEVPVVVGSEGATDVISAEGSYLHPLMEQLIVRSQSASADQLPALFAALAAGAAARDLQAYSVDPASQAMLDQFAVTGRLSSPNEGEQDADAHRIAVIDSNVSWSKPGPGIHRDTTVLLREDGLVDVIVRWENRVPSLDAVTYPRAAFPGAIYIDAPLEASAAVPEGLQPGIYGNLAKVYLPPGAEVLAIRGTTGPPRLLSTDAEVVAGGLVVVPGGTTVTILISYRPAEAPRVLELWKQGGWSTTRTACSGTQTASRSRCRRGPSRAMSG